MADYTGTAPEHTPHHSDKGLCRAMASFANTQEEVAGLAENFSLSYQLFPAFQT
ncbi:MAG: hypothetical protein RMJ66_03705 [Bacteroidia bacterium]|nr:hypothetical protein [Bacteroidia bacterium]MDW8134152.1 hypothetical protein [Bacteroidia bacterium]